MSSKTPASGTGFEPKIIAFVCTWCTYTGADLAGTSRMQMPPNVRVVRLNCSSRVNPQFVMRAFERGADGVIISGCHPGDCHYSTGNYFTRRRIAIFSELLDFVGVDSRRLTMSWVSASGPIPPPRRSAWRRWRGTRESRKSGAVDTESAHPASRYTSTGRGAATRNTI